MCSGTQESLGQLKILQTDLQSKIPLNQIYKINMRARTHNLIFIFNYFFNLSLKRF